MARSGASPTGSDPEVVSARALTPAPASVARLFPEFELDDPTAIASRNLAIGRLLEEGEGADLRWLAQAVGEAEIRAWLERCGGRQLSRRSLRFWSLMLCTALPEVDPVREALWPL